MKHSYLIAGIRFEKFVSMIVRNKGVSIKYLGRFFFLLNAAIWSSIFTLLEKNKYKKKLKAFSHSPKPLFIIGNWRTGTTFLHQLISLDENFATPTVYSVSNPDHMLFSKKYYIPIMKKALGKKRPMDNVKIGVDEPQEDEYALIKTCKNLPLEKMIFNKSNEFFLNEYRDYNPLVENEFRKQIKLMEKKIAFQSKKNVVFKNPFHSLRILLLKEIFPDAKFIHIYRNPEDVIPSTINMWNIVGRQNLLKGKWNSPSVKDISYIYKNIVLSVKKDLGNLDAEQYSEIKYEELDNNPVETVKRIYKEINLTFSDDYEQKLQEFCNQLKAYKKNKYNLKEEDKEYIKKEFSDILPEYYNQASI